MDAVKLNISKPAVNISKVPLGNASFSLIKELPNGTLRYDCGGYCSGLNMGLSGGNVLGTAPFCSVDCADDCPISNLWYLSTACIEPVSDGSGCATGHKMCCCDVPTCQNVN